MSATTFSALDDVWDMILKEQAIANDKMRLEDIIINKQIEEPVLICNKKTRDIIESALPHRFCILASDLCNDSVFMVTDRILANNIRQNLNWLKEKNNAEFKSEN